MHLTHEIWAFIDVAVKDVGAEDLAASLDFGKKKKKKSKIAEEGEGNGADGGEEAPDMDLDDDLNLVCCFYFLL